MNKARRHRAKAEARRRKAERIVAQRYTTTWSRLGEPAEKIDDRRAAILALFDAAERHEETRDFCDTHAYGYYVSEGDR